MSKLNEQQRKIFDIVITAVQILAVVISVILSIIIIANPSVNTAEVGSGKFKLMPVLTDSMKGDAKDNFEKGDLIIATGLPDNPATLEVGQIVTYLGFANGQNNQLITHRVVGYAMDNLDEDDPAVVADSTLKYYEGGTSHYIMITDTSLIRNADGSFKQNSHGVAYDQCMIGLWTCHDYPVVDRSDLGALHAESELVTFDNLRAMYSSHIGGIGKAIFWLQDATHFLLVIVLPLAALFIYNLVLFIQMIMQAKVASAREQMAAEGAEGGMVIDEEEIRRRAIAEYLASQQMQKEAEEAKDQDTDDTSTQQ